MLAVPVAAFAAGMAFAGCGTSAGPPPTKSAFIKQADAICLKVGPRAAHALEALGREQRQSSASGRSETEEINRVSLPIIQKEAEELAGLTPPKGQEKEIALIVSGLEKGVRKMEEDPSIPLSTAPSSPFFPTDMRARRYGFQVCGR